MILTAQHSHTLLNCCVSSTVIYYDSDSLHFCCVTAMLNAKAPYQKRSERMLNHLAGFKCGNKLTPELHPFAWAQQPHTYVYCRYTHMYF